MKFAVKSLVLGMCIAGASAAFATSTIRSSAMPVPVCSPGAKNCVMAMPVPVCSPGAKNCEMAMPVPVCSPGAKNCAL